MRYFTWKLVFFSNILCIFIDFSPNLKKDQIIYYKIGSHIHLEMQIISFKFLLNVDRIKRWSELYVGQQEQQHLWEPTQITHFWYFQIGEKYAHVYLDTNLKWLNLFLGDSNFSKYAFKKDIQNALQKQ